MQKILILSRSFPPSTRTAASRTLSFAKYLHHFGYYPIIVTRNWDVQENVYHDIQLRSGDFVTHDKKDGYEVYYIPFKGTFSNRSGTKNKIFKRITTLIEIYFGNNRLLNPNYDVYKFALNFLKINKEIKKVLITAPPFEYFHFGYLLNKKLKIKWIADYRDEWNTSGSIHVDNTNKSLIEKIFLPGNRTKIAREKKWLSSCHSFMSTVPYAIPRISSLINKRGVLLINGFDESDLPIDRNPALFNKFTIAYAGWLYPTQQIEVLSEAVNKLAKEYLSEFRFEILFIGGKSFNEMEERLRDLFRNCPDVLNVTPRVPKKESLHLQLRSHLLLLCSHKNNNSIPSSKLYEYIMLKKPVLVCPSDNGIIEQTLSYNKQGIFCSDVESTYNYLKKCYLDHLKGIEPQVKINTEVSDTYNRKNQIQILVNELNSI